MSMTHLNATFSKKHVFIPRATLKAYYRLTKPGIIYGNLLTTIGGFLYGSGKHFSLALFLAVVAGTSFVIASACAVNNYMDRDIDSVMKRTQKRALVSGDISATAALTFAGILGMLGVFILWKYTNTPTLLLGLLGFVSYVGMYTPSKRITEYSTLIGSISGATPIAAGYTAATGHFSIAASVLFLIMVIWQMPHFYAIAIFRRSEYAEASIPILSVVRGIRITKLHIIAYIVLFVLLVLGFSLFGYTSFMFFVIMGISCAYWLRVGAIGFRKSTDDIRWSRKVFGASLLVLLVMSTALALNPWLP